MWLPEDRGGAIAVKWICLGEVVAVFWGGGITYIYSRQNSHAMAIAIACYCLTFQCSGSEWPTHSYDVRLGDSSPTKALYLWYRCNDKRAEVLALINEYPELLTRCVIYSLIFWEKKRRKTTQAAKHSLHQLRKRIYISFIQSAQIQCCLFIVKSWVHL